MAVELLSSISAAFLLGVLTPTTAVCVLPLYPGFLVYLSTQLSGTESDRKKPALFGVLISTGVISFMILIGLIFTTILQVSLTTVIGVISPIAFVILLIISLMLILDVEIGRFLPKTRTPGFKNPLMGAFVYGFFFGAIVLPCNPLFIAALFARTISAMSFMENILSFFFFGAGMASPLLVFSLISTASSAAVIGFLTRRKRIINVIAGTIMLAISVYYLVFVFRVLG
jgi:cytochrome c-type biogenesis protein